MEKMGKIVGYIFVCFILLFSGWLTWVFIQNIQTADANVKTGLIGSFGILLRGGPVLLDSRCFRLEGINS